MAEMSKALQEKLLSQIDGHPVSVWIKVDHIDFHEKTVTLSLLAADKEGVVYVDMVEHELPEGHSAEIRGLEAGLTIKLQGSDKRLFDDE